MTRKLVLTYTTIFLKSWVRNRAIFARHTGPSYDVSELPDTIIRTLKALNRHISAQDAVKYSARANEARKGEIERDERWGRFPKTTFSPSTCHDILLYCVPVRIVLDCIEAAGWQFSTMTSTYPHLGNPSDTFIFVSG